CEHEFAGWLRHDLNRYLAMYAPDFRNTDGRGEQPDRFDLTLDLRQVAAVRPLQFRFRLAPGQRLTVADARADVDLPAGPARPPAAGASRPGRTVSSASRSSTG